MSPPLPGVTLVDFDDQQAALAWLTLEFPTLQAWLMHAALTGYLTNTWQLAWATPDFLQRQGRWNEWAETQQMALAAAERLGDPLAEAFARHSLAGAFGALDQYDDAHRQLGYALDRFAEVGHGIAEARTLLNVGALLSRQGRLEDALRHTQQALSLFEEESDTSGQAYVHNGTGWLHTQLEQHFQALIHCQRALTLQQQVDDKLGQAATWDSIGYAYHNLGHYGQAIAAFEQSIGLVRAHGDLFREADVLSRLGDTLCASGNNDPARQKWPHRTNGTCSLPSAAATTRITRATRCFPIAQFFATHSSSPTWWPTWSESVQRR